MKHFAILAICFLCFGSVSRATVVFFQDFSASNPTIGGVAVTEGVLQEQDGVTIVGGDAAAQATNGDFTFTMTASNGATTGNGFIINAPAGFVPAGAPAGFEPGQVLRTSMSQPHLALGL